MSQVQATQHLRTFAGEKELPPCAGRGRGILTIACNRLSIWVNQDDAEVHHVGVCGSGLQKSAERLEEMIGIMAGEVICVVQTAGNGVRQQLGVADGPRGVRGAVLAVRAAAEDGY